MDRTGLEFHFVFAKTRTVSHCHLDTMQIDRKLSSGTMFCVCWRRLPLWRPKEIQSQFAVRAIIFGILPGASPSFIIWIWTFHRFIADQHHQRRHRRRQVPTSAEIEEVRGLSCGALDLQFASEEDAARELHSQKRPLTGGKPVCTGSDAAAARSQTSAGLCVS